MINIEGFLKHFIGFASMSLIAWIIFHLIPDGNYASALIGIMCTFVGNILASSGNEQSDNTSKKYSTFRQLSQVGSFAAFCFAIAVSWFLALGADNFLNSHLEAMIHAGLIKIDNHVANTALQIGWFEEIGRYVLLPSLLLISGVVGLLSPKKVFFPIVCSLSCVFGIYVIGNIIWELTQGETQMFLIVRNTLLIGQSVSTMGQSLQAIIVIGALLGSIVAVAALMRVMVLLFRLSIIKTMQP